MAEVEPKKEQWCRAVLLVWSVWWWMSYGGSECWRVVLALLGSGFERRRISTLGENNTSHDYPRGFVGWYCWQMMGISLCHTPSLNGCLYHQGSHIYFEFWITPFFLGRTPLAYPFQWHLWIVASVFTFAGLRIGLCL